MESLKVGLRNNIPSIDMHQPHMHDQYELYYLKEGKRQYYIDNSVYTISAGSFILVKKNVFHKTISVDNSPFTRYIVMFDENIISTHLLHCFDERCFRIPEKDRSYIEGILSVMYKEYEISSAYHKEIIVHYLSILLLYLSRNMPSISVESDPTDDNIKKVLKFIDTNFQHDISLDEAAKYANMSRTYFSTKFKQSMGIGFSEYLNSIRIMHSKNMLKETKLSLQEIAISCGFNNGNYFIKIFKEYTGMTPNIYRKHSII